MLPTCPHCGDRTKMIRPGHFVCRRCNVNLAHDVAGIETPPGTPIMMEIGRRGALDPETARNVAHWVVEQMKRLPATVPVLINLYGFDDDPREIPDIPEACAYVVAWAREVAAAGVARERFLEESQQLIQICAMTLLGHRECVTFTDRTPQDMDEQIARFRRTVH